jgi:uncharacterized heparinase superfamily protein
MGGLPARVGRLWRTVRWLRAEQIVGRLALRLRRVAVDDRPAPPRRAQRGPWVAVPARAPSLVGPTRWRLIGEEHELERIGWDDPAIALLWRYNQHYFDDLQAEGWPGRQAWHRALIERWCDACTPGRGTAWTPYPTSLRIVNWLKWHWAGEPLAERWWHSLAVQARWLERHLEWHLLGNHLFVNAKALVFAGLAFHGPEAARWLATGVRILQRELPEQILADGGQFERSPMYHALALEDVLDLLNAMAAMGVDGTPAERLVPELQQRARAMLGWLRCMRLPDGSLARMNDTADGIAPPTDAIEAYAAALQVQAGHPPAAGLLALEPSGYRRVARGRMVAIVDVAPVGPDYLPGHAHADTLSFELAIDGRAVVVNRGTSVYGTGPRRQVERGTAAHSTLQIGDHDSSEVWAGFRVGRRARLVDVLQDDRGPDWRIEAAHEGYAHLPRRPVHRRRWTFGTDQLVVEDRVEPTPQEPARARFHLAPGLGLAGGGAEWSVIDAQGRPVAVARIDVGRGALEPWQHAERFGHLVPACTLAVDASADGQARVRWSW